MKFSTRRVTSHSFKFYLGYLGSEHGEECDAAETHSRCIPFKVVIQALPGYIGKIKCFLAKG